VSFTPPDHRGDETDSTGARTGLCSVTFRQLSAAQVAQLAAEAQLVAVEWGSDLHAPPGDPDGLDAVRELSVAHGLSISSYGSYWRAGVTAASEFAAIVAAAQRLGAPRVRIWAGDVGSSAAGTADWRRVVLATRRAAAVAADHGVELAFEYHADSLTDSSTSTLRLLDEVGSPNVSTYWQPPRGLTSAEAVQNLSAVIDHVSAVHVFSWWPDQQRLPLLARKDLWLGVLRVLHRAESSADLLLEFVADDDPTTLHCEAASLRALMGEAQL
jgi:3-dehydroshikimate dehydratase